MIHFITYNIKDSKRSNNFGHKIHDLGDSIYCLDNSYFLESNKTNKEIYDILKDLTTDEDKFIVMSNISYTTLNGWIGANTSEWLKDKMR